MDFAAVPSGAAAFSYLPVLWCGVFYLSLLGLTDT